METLWAVFDYEGKMFNDLLGLYQFSRPLTTDEAAALAHWIV
jgi:hypothetical protein